MTTTERDVEEVLKRYAADRGIAWCRMLVLIRESDAVIAELLSFTNSERLARSSTPARRSRLSVRRDPRRRFRRDF